MKKILIALIFASSLLSHAEVKKKPKSLITFKFAFEKFVDELPRLPRIHPQNGKDLEIKLVETSVKLHRDFPAVKAFSYNGSVPGPVIEVEKNQKVRVHWKNQLPAAHFFAAPLGGMSAGLPDVKAVTHLHGAVVTQNSITDRLYNNDGWPDAFTVNGQEQITDYPNEQDARVLWYHDHAMGDTGRNVAAGLAGMYLIHDDYERSLGLPEKEFDIPLMLSTHGFNGDGSRYYTPDLATEFYGNTISVNGKLWPVLTVEPRKYRFRVLNGANARTFALKLMDQQTEAPGPAFYQIGSDSGFMENISILNDPADPKAKRLVLAPAERADIVIDFSKHAGKSLMLDNNSVDSREGEIFLPQVMLIKVQAKVSQPDTSKLPLHLKPIRRIPVAESINTRAITFNEMPMADGRPMLMLNNKSWTDPVSERPVLGTTEIWELINPLADVHPFHIHLVQFQVLDRRPFDTEEFKKTGKVVFTGAAQPPEPNEMGWKDVVQTASQQVTRIIMKFEPFAGHYVYHCHILEHEDMDMMRPFDVVKP